MSASQYGAMFVPQVVFAILASAFAPKLARRSSLRRVLLAGFAGNIVSMTLLALSRLLIGAPDTAFAVLLVATAALVSADDCGEVVSPAQCVGLGGRP